MLIDVTARAREHAQSELHLDEAGVRRAVRFALDLHLLKKRGRVEVVDLPGRQFVCRQNGGRMVVLDARRTR